MGLSTSAPPSFHGLVSSLGFIYRKSRILRRLCPRGGRVRVAVLSSPLLEGYVDGETTKVYTPAYQGHSLSPMKAV